MAHEPQQQPEPEYDPDELAQQDSAQQSSAQQESGTEDAPRPAGRRLSGPVTSSDLIGQTLEGRYRFDALLGEGTFARVFRVYDLHRRVYLAAKVLRSDIAQEPMFLERFRREARVLERLQHPNIVRYYDIVESGDVVFILTDYIAGNTLQSVLRQLDGPMNPLDSLDYLTPLAAALHFAHNEGVVHRDLKPSNILIDGNGSLYVTDFGIARIVSDSSTLTMDTTSTLGTPHYMSPEQIMVGEVGPTTDVYALGVMLYQMYTGHLPFTGEMQSASGTTAAMRIVYEHLHLPPTPPTQLNPTLSKAVEDVVLKCMQKDPDQRYQTVSDVYEALNNAVGTPSLSLDAAAIAEAASEPPAPQVERVPTGIGGASRIAQDDAYFPDVAYDDQEDEEDFDHLAWGDDWREFGKRKREMKREIRREVRKAKHEARSGAQDRHRRSAQDYAEMGEKEREKQQESDEKNDEKSREKGREVNVEKGEFWMSFSPSDRLSQFTWGGMVLWAGIVYLLSDYAATASLFSDRWAWILGGAGAMLIAEVGARLVLPEFRTKPGARLVVGAILLMVGLGINFSFGTLWPLILIVIGLSLLINQMVD